MLAGCWFGTDDFFGGGKLCFKYAFFRFQLSYISIDIRLYQIVLGIYQHDLKIDTILSSML